MYYGESNASVDDKGRLNVPVQFRSIMDVLDHDTWFLTRGFDGAVFVFHKEAWDKLLTQTGGGATLDPRTLDFRRMFLGSVAKVKRDRQGRLALPGHLREHAGIDREAVLVGVEDHLEIWSKEGWRAFQSRQAERYKDMAAELFGKGEAQAVRTEGDVRDA